MERKHSPPVHRFRIVLQVVILALGLAGSGCKGEKKHEAGHSQPPSAADDSEVSASEHESAGGKSESSLTFEDGKEIAVQGAIAYQTGALIRLFISDQPLTCDGHQNGLVVPVDIVNRITPEGESSRWVVHDRSARRALSDEAGDPPLDALETDNNHIQLHVSDMEIKHIDHGFMVLDGTIDAEKCPGTAPGLTAPSSRAKPASGDLQLVIGSAHIPIQGARLTDQPGGRFVLSLSSEPTTCQDEGFHDVVLDLFFTSLERSASGLTLRGERIRGHYNDPALTLQVGWTPADTGLVFQITGSARVGPFTVGFEGESITALDCRTGTP